MRKSARLGGRPCRTSGETPCWCGPGVVPGSDRGARDVVVNDWGVGGEVAGVADVAGVAERWREVAWLQGFRPFEHLAKPEGFATFGPRSDHTSCTAELTDSRSQTPHEEAALGE